MIDTDSVLYKFYRRLSKSNAVADIKIPPSDAYYVAKAIYDRTGESYGGEWVWISLWLEALIGPDEIDVIPQWYLDKFYGGVSPNIAELKKKLWVKHKKYLLEEFSIDLPWE